MGSGWSVDIKRGTLAIGAALTLLAWAVISPAALAEEPVNWQLGMQAAASPVREQIDSLHDKLLVIATVIVLFVLALLVVIIVRFGAKRHPISSPTTGNRLIEVTWTTVPVLILVYIAIPSFKLLYYADRVRTADFTVNVIGHQWYWSYEYPDQGGFTFDSTMLQDDDLATYHEPRLLGVDKPMVVPVGATVRVIVGGTDVIHSWFVPPLGVQEYAVVGRKNESWMRIDRPGTYYGQCNQICGMNHPFMPVEVKAVSQDDFNRWVKNPDSLWNVPQKKASLIEVPNGSDAGQHLAARSAF